MHLEFKVAWPITAGGDTWYFSWELEGKSIVAGSPDIGAYTIQKQ